MKILISGATGLIGSALADALGRAGDHVVRLVRQRPRPGQAEVWWDPAAGELDAASLEGLDAVVHLAGENIATGRWTASKKARIRASRVDGTRLLATALATLAQPPKVLVTASGVSVYGNRGDEPLDETSAPGQGFLADVCHEWEAASTPATEAGIRAVALRMGMVLAAHGGALARMLPPFRLGLGGRIGTGRQYVSWIALDDLVAVFRHVLATESLVGPVNATAPNPVTNAQFAKAIGSVLHRPTFLGLPATVARLMLGEMADALLLASVRAVPRKLQETEFVFQYPNVRSALQHLLIGPMA